MKLKVLLIAVVLAVCIHGAVFAKGIIEERKARELEKLNEQVYACLEAGDYSTAIPLLKRMHELKPDVLELVEIIGNLYIDLPEDRPTLSNASFWLMEAEKRGSLNNLVYYNLACIYSLNREIEKAETAMNKAIVTGFSNFEWMSLDDDLVNFRTGSWWKDIADNYMRINQQLSVLNEFASVEKGKSVIDRITFFDGAVTAFKELAPNIPALLCKPLFLLASSYKAMGKYTSAEQNFLEYKAIIEMIFGKEHLTYISSLDNLGSLYTIMGDYAKAESFFLEAIALSEKVYGKEQTYSFYTNTLTNLGNLYSIIGNYAKAESSLLEAVAIKEKVLGKKDPSYAGSLIALGLMYMKIGDYSRAEINYLEAKAILEEVRGKENTDYAASLNNIGFVYQKMGDYAKAESCFLEAMAIIEKVSGKGNQNYAALLGNLGNLYEKNWDYTNAEKYYFEAKAILEEILGKEHPDYATALNDIGNVYSKMGNYGEAERYLLEAKAIREKLLGKEHPDYITTLGSLYSMYLSKKEYSQAFIFKQEEIKLVLGLVNRNFSFLSEQQRTMYWDYGSNLNSAAFETGYSLSFFHSVPESNVLNYDNALFSKGLLLRTTNAVRDAIYSSGDQTLIDRYEELGRLRQKISALRQKEGSDETYIKSLETQAESLEKSLAQSSAAFREFHADLNVNWQNVMNNLQNNEAAVEFVSFRIFEGYWTGTVQYAALVLKKDSKEPVWVPLCEESELNELLDRVNDGRTPEKQAFAIYNQYGLKLFGFVWEPLEKELSGVTTVYYSPSGLLHKIAFNALPIDDSFDVRLADKYNLNLVSSTREVVHLDRNPAKTTQISSAVLYGGIDYNADEKAMRAAVLSYNNEKAARASVEQPVIATRGSVGGTGPMDFLENSLPEVQNIQGYLNKNKIPNTLYQGNLGSEESFKNLSGKKTGLIHLATHGFFQQDAERKHDEREQQQRATVLKPEENPLFRSWLLMAGGNNTLANKPLEGMENGILTAAEIASIDLLGAKLVVLSACQTGLGDVNNSEGVFGLQRAFKLAGVETLIMSLWSVSDEATSILMSTFYQEWLISGKSKQEAFKEAQKKVRGHEDYELPFHWAAFVMMD